jgi:hypothetical protein
MDNIREKFKSFITTVPCDLNIREKFNMPTSPSDLAGHILLQDLISHKFISIPFLQQKDTIIYSTLKLQRLLYLKQQKCT